MLLSGVKKTEKTFLCILLIAGTISLVVAFFTWSPKWCESAGLIFDIAGIIQLEVSGFFDKWLEKYADEEKYPYGPPSRITRQIVDDTEKPIRNWIQHTFFFEHRMGLWLLVLGFMFQLAANWLPGTAQ